MSQEKNILIVQISIDNANRASAIANIKMTELKKKFKQDGEYAILVKAHLKHYQLKVQLELL